MICKGTVRVKPDFRNEIFAYYFSRGLNFDRKIAIFIESFHIIETIVKKLRKSILGSSKSKALSELLNREQTSKEST